MNNINNLLLEVSSIQNKFDQIAKITGEHFNVFSVLKMDSKEVQMHSALIGELLNPKGSHGLEDKPLQYFIEVITNKLRSKNIKNYETKFLLQTKFVTTVIEKHIGNTNEDKTEGGRIDIIIQEKNRNAIIIENKIYAIEQPNQLIRYNNYSKESPILYLTLNGEAPTSHGNLIENVHYFTISYKDDIIQWLEICLKEAVDFPMLREVIKQYIYLIKKLTYQTTNDKMNEEIKNTILRNKENIKSALNILYADPKQIICEEFFDCIKKELSNTFKCRNYNSKLIGKKSSGMLISEEPRILLWFGTDYNQLELGIIDQDDNWIKQAKINEYFDECDWENILDQNNIDGIVNSIKQLNQEAEVLKIE